MQCKCYVNSCPHMANFKFLFLFFGTLQNFKNIRIFKWVGTEPYKSSGSTVIIQFGAMVIWGLILIIFFPTLDFFIMYYDYSHKKKKNQRQAGSNNRNYFPHCSWRLKIYDQGVNRIVSVKISSWLTDSCFFPFSVSSHSLSSVHMLLWCLFLFL